MITTNVLVVQCDDCGTVDIFRATPAENIVDGPMLLISEADLKKDGWELTAKRGFGLQHLCPVCRAK